MIQLATSLLEQAEEVLTRHGFKFRSSSAPGNASISFFGPTRLLDLESAEKVLALFLGSEVLTRTANGRYEGGDA